MVVRGAEYERRPMDDYSTPLYVLRAALSVFELGRTVVDPCAGRGNVVRALRGSGRRAFGYDVKRGFDFLTNDPPLRTSYDVFTNPPYGPGGRLALKFIIRALEVTERWRSRVVFLLPVDFDSGRTRRVVFADHPAFARKVVLLSRIRWFDNASGSTNHAWFEWDWKRANDRVPTIEYITGEIEDDADDRRSRNGRAPRREPSPPPQSSGRRKVGDAAEQPPSDPPLQLAFGWGRSQDSVSEGDPR